MSAPKMSPPKVTLKIGHQTYTLSEGAIIGRARFATVRLLDPRVSEAHALLSVRDGGWWLLALRGQLEDPAGLPLPSALRLELGSRLRLGAGPMVEVLAVPPAPEGGALVSDMLHWPVLQGTHVYVRGEGWAERDDYRDEEVEVVVTRHDSEGWTAAPTGGPARALVDGQSIRAGGVDWTWRAGDRGYTQRDLRLILRESHVELQYRDPPVVLKGKVASFIQALAIHKRANPQVGLSSRALLPLVYPNELADNSGHAVNKVTNLRKRANEDAKECLGRELVSIRDGLNHLNVELDNVKIEALVNESLKH